MKLLNKTILTLAFLVVGFFSYTSFADAANRYWVGGGSSTNWNATGNTNWSTTSGGANNASVPGSSDAVIFDANSGSGTANISANITILSLDMTNFTGTLTHAAVNLTLAGGPTTFGSGMTYTPISTSNITGNPGNFTTAGKLMPRINVSSGTLTLQDNMTFMNSRLSQISLTGGLDLNGFTVSGYDGIARLLITSSTAGTQRTVTRSGGTFAYADFRDITLESAYDASGITGGSGDALGNNNITFTTAQTNYWVGNTGNWSDVNEWASSSGGTGGTGRVPLPQDNATFDANSFSGTGFTVTADMNRIGKDIDFSAVGTDNPTWTVPNDGYDNSIYGSLTLASGMSVGGSNGRIFEGRGSHTLTNAGVSYSRIMTITMPGGTLTLQDAYTSSSNITVNNGTFDANDYNVTANAYTFNSTLTELKMGNSTWTVTGAFTVWTMTTSAVTITPEGSTINMSNTTTSNKNFNGGNKTYNTLTITGDNVSIVNNNTFATLNLNNPNRTFGTKFTGTSTTTITTLFATNATTTAARVVATSTNASVYELKFTGGGTVCVNYMTFARTLGTPASTWFVGVDSSDAGNNSGLSFTTCAVGSVTTPAVIFKGNVLLKGNTLLK